MLNRELLSIIIISLPLLSACGGGGGGSSSGSGGGGSGGSSEETPNITPNQGPGDLSNIAVLEVGNKWLYQHLFDDPDTSNIDRELQYRAAEITQRIGTLYDFEYITYDDQAIDTELEYLNSEPAGLAFHGPVEDILSDASATPFSYYAFYSLAQGQSNEYQLSNQTLQEDLDGDSQFETYSVTTEIARETDESLETFIGSLTAQKFIISITIAVQGSAGSSASETGSLIQWRVPGTGLVKQQYVELNSAGSVVSILEETDILGYEIDGNRNGMSNLDLLSGDPSQCCDLNHNPIIIVGNNNSLLLYTDLIDPNLGNDSSNISLFAKLLSNDGEVSDTSFSYPQISPFSSDNYTGVWHDDQFKILLSTESEDLRLVSLDFTGTQLDIDPLGLLIQSQISGSGKTGYSAIATNGPELGIALPHSDSQDSIYYWTIDSDDNLSARLTLAENISGGTLLSAPTSLYHDGDDFIFLWLQYNTAAPFDYDLLAKRFGDAPATSASELLSNDTYSQFMSVMEIAGGSLQVRMDFIDGPEYKSASLNSSNPVISVDNISVLSGNPLALGRNSDTFLWNDHLIGKGARAVLSSGDEYIVWQHGIRTSLGALLSRP